MFGGRRVEIKTPEQLLAMRRAGKVVAQALMATTAEVRPGITTGELDAIAAGVIASAGATPSFLNYGEEHGEGGFPGVICVSVNDEVVHGIPGDRVLREGDLVSIDCGAIVDGWHGDAARSVFVGQPATAEAAELCRVTHDALWAGIGAAKLGGRVTDISAAIEGLVRSRDVDYGIAENLVGHGIGSQMHMEPNVPNEGKPGRGPRIVEGMALAIEPMLTLGTPVAATLDDDWTMVTRDGSWACHWEHTITVTADGLWVLTAEDGGAAMLERLGLPFGPRAD